MSSMAHLSPTRRDREWYSNMIDSMEREWATEKARRLQEVRKPTVHMQIAPFPRYGLVYDSNIAILRGSKASEFRDALYGDGVTENLRSYVDMRLGELFQGLIDGTELFEAAGYDGKNVDLLRFALEQVPYVLPSWARGVAPRIVGKVVTSLIAARRLFVEMSGQNFCPTPNEGETVKNIDTYIGCTPAPPPENVCLGNIRA